MSTQAFTSPEHSSQQTERVREEDPSGSFFENVQPIMTDYTALKSDLGAELHRDLPPFRRAIHGALTVFDRYRTAWVASGQLDSDCDWPDIERTEELAVVSRFMQQNASQSDIAVINDILEEKDKDDDRLKQCEHVTLIELTHALKRSFPLNQETTAIQRILALWVSEELDLLPSSYADIKQRALASQHVAQNKSAKHPWNIA